MPPALVRCPNCGHALVTVDVPTLPGLQAAPPAPRSRDDVPLLLRIPEAARLLGIGRTTMYQLVAKGEVPVLRIGRSVRVSRAAVEQLAGQ
jgi:excisionase family DNA binding protein